MRGARIALAAALAALVVGGCATAVDVPGAAPATVSAAIAPVPLRNAGFEADPIPGRACPPSWGCTMHSDSTSFRFALATDPGSRGRFLTVTRVKAEPWALVAQTVPVAGLRGKRLRVSARVNAEQLDGGAGPMIILQGVGGRTLDHRKALLGRGPGWQRASVEIDVPAGAEIVEIGLIVEGGGTTGFDDVEAAVLAPGGH